MILGLFTFLKGDKNSQGECSEEISESPTPESSKPNRLDMADGSYWSGGQSMDLDPEGQTEDGLKAVRKIQGQEQGVDFQENNSGKAISVALADDESSEVVSVHFDTFVNAEEVSVRTSDTARRPPVGKSSGNAESGPRRKSNISRSPSSPAHDLNPPTQGRVGYDSLEGETAKLGSEELALLVSQYSNPSTGLVEKKDQSEDDSLAAETTSALELETGFKYWRQGNPIVAMRHFEAAVETGQRQALGYYMIGLCYLRKENIWEAIKHFKFGLHGDGISLQETLALYFEIGRSYEKINDLKEANYYYAKISRLDPAFRDDESRFEYGDRLRAEVVGGSKQDATLVQRKSELPGNRKNRRSKNNSGMRAFFKKMGF